MLPQVEFAYNATRALGIEHTPFEANVGFSLEEPLDLLFNMQPSIPISQDAIEQLKLLQGVYALVHSVLQPHRDEMQARSESSTTPHFVRGDKVTIVTKHLVLREQQNRKLRDRQLGHVLVEEQIGKHNYRLKLLATIRLHSMYHVNNLRPCSTTSLRPHVPVNVPKVDGEEFEVSRNSVVCINLLPRRRGKYSLFMTHFSDDDIPPFWHDITLTSCTLSRRAFLSPCNCFSKGA
jgi:hypothetical protein